MSLVELDPIPDDDIDADDRRAERAFPLRRNAVDAARAVLIDRLARAGVKVLNPTVITEAVCRAFVTEDRATPPTRAYHADTVSMSEMKVGETRTFKGFTIKVYRGRVKSARRRMHNRSAMWTMLCLPDSSVQVTRIPDGTKPEKRQWSPIVARLVALRVGERTLVPEIKASPDGRFRIPGYHTQAARLRMDNPDARWRGTHTTKGLRAERVR